MTKGHILIIGGAGFIGSHVNQLLCQQGYSTIILDNLSSGHRAAVLQGTFFQGEMNDKSLLHHIFTHYPITAVMHFAAHIDVGESVEQPLKYYQNNVAATLTLLDIMQQHACRAFIFSSSAAVYGIPQHPSLTESHPCCPINPYGKSKWMIETILHDLNMRSCCLRYFNAAGGDPEGHIKNHRLKETNLIPKLLRHVKEDLPIKIYGTDYDTPDGTCIRDYIHVTDLGTAHIAAMEKLLQGGESTIYNLGNGQGYSVREVITSAEKILGKKIKVKEDARRPGDPAILVANAHKAKRELNWQPMYPRLDTMIEHAWKAMRD